MKGQASDPQALPLHTSHDMALLTLGSPQGSGYHYPYLQPRVGGWMEVMSMWGAGAGRLGGVKAQKGHPWAS